MKYEFFNCDCVEGARKYIGDNSVDLVICDPPYGIHGDRLDKHYNRNEGHVLDGYVEVPAEKYPAFTRDWVDEAARILKPGGTLYAVSGYTNLIHVLNALHRTDLAEVNHIIWKYNFGVYTKTKYISSHYHILFYRKPGARRTFNAFCRFGDTEKAEDGGSLNYRDREDVWLINREYRPGKIKNKNALPEELLAKLILYSSNPGDLVCDMFLGSFSTAKVAKGLNRRVVGFEKSKAAFDHQLREIEKLEPGYLVPGLRTPPENVLVNQGKPLSENEKNRIRRAYEKLLSSGYTKKNAIDDVSARFGRGYWSILRLIDGTTNKSTTRTAAQQSKLP